MAHSEYASWKFNNDVARSWYDFAFGSLMPGDTGDRTDEAFNLGWFNPSGACPYDVQGKVGACFIAGQKRAMSAISLGKYDAKLAGPDVRRLRPPKPKKPAVAARSELVYKVRQLNPNTGKLIKEWPSSAAAAVALGTSTAAISHARVHGTVAAGYRWAYGDQHYASKKQRPVVPAFTGPVVLTRIERLDPVSLEVLGSYTTQEAAAKDAGLSSRQAVAQAIKRYRRQGSKAATTAGCYWRITEVQ